MSRVELAMNGTRPLADTASGAAGEVTGTERAKLQSVGAVVEQVLGANIALGTSLPTLIAITLGVGTWLISAEAEISISAPGYRATFQIQNTTAALSLIGGSETMTAPSQHRTIGPVVAVLGTTCSIALRGGVETGGGATLLANESLFGIAPTTKITAVRIA